MDAAMAEMVKNGILGAVFIIVTVPLALYTRKLGAELKLVQDQRALDAQQVVDKLLALNDKWNTTVHEQLRTLEAIDETMKDVKSALQSVRDILLKSPKE